MDALGPFAEAARVAGIGAIAKTGMPRSKRAFRTALTCLIVEDFARANYYASLPGEKEPDA